MKRRIVAVLASAGALLSLTACAAAAPAAAPATAPPTVPADVPADVAATAARLDDLTRRITGNLEENRAAERLNYHRAEGALVACMAAAGRTYRPLPFVSRYDEFTDADLGYGNGSGSVIGSLTQRGRRIVLNELASARRARAGVLDDGSASLVPEADVPAFNRCNGPSGYRSPNDFEPPADAYKLSVFPDLVSQPIPGLAGAMAAYEPCMKDRYGYEIDGDDPTEFLFQPRIDYRDAPVDGRPPNAAWTRGLAEIDAVFAADAECRRPAYVLAMRQVARNLDGWEARHRTQLDAIRADWRQRVADAARLPG